MADAPRIFPNASAKLFHSEVLKWKQLAAKFWSLIFVLGLVLVHSVTAKHSIFGDGLTRFGFAFLANFFSLEYWTYSLLVVACFWPAFAFNDALFRVTPKVYANNYDKIVHIIASMQGLSLMCTLATSVLVSFALLQFYAANTALNTVYIVGFCGFSSVYMRLKFTMNETLLLEWPIIEQSKYARFKAKLYTVCLNTLKSVLGALCVWHLLYWTLVSTRTWVMWQKKDHLFVAMLSQCITLNKNRLINILFDTVMP